MNNPPSESKTFISPSREQTPQRDVSENLLYLEVISFTLHPCEIILNYSLLLLIQFEKYKIEKLFRRALSKESFSFFFFFKTPMKFEAPVKESGNSNFFRAKEKTGEKKRVTRKGYSYRVERGTSEKLASYLG